MSMTPSRRRSCLARSAVPSLFAPPSSTFSSASINKQTHSSLLLSCTRIRSSSACMRNHSSQGLLQHRVCRQSHSFLGRPLLLCTQTHSSASRVWIPATGAMTGNAENGHGQGHGKEGDVETHVGDMNWFAGTNAPTMDG